VNRRKRRVAAVTRSIQRRCRWKREELREVVAQNGQRQRRLRAPELARRRLGSAKSISSCLMTSSHPVRGLYVSTLPQAAVRPDALEFPRPWSCSLISPRKTVALLWSDCGRHRSEGKGLLMPGTQKRDCSASGGLLNVKTEKPAFYRCNRLPTGRSLVDSRRKSRWSTRS
jgi:hypothetical protein